MRDGLVVCINDVGYSVDELENVVSALKAGQHWIAYQCGLIEFRLFPFELLALEGNLHEAEGLVTKVAPIFDRDPQVILEPLEPVIFQRRMEKDLVEYYLKHILDWEKIKGKAACFPDWRDDYRYQVPRSCSDWWSNFEDKLLEIYQRWKQLPEGLSRQEQLLKLEETSPIQSEVKVSTIVT